MSEVGETYESQVARLVRRAADGRTPLSQVDGGEWGSVGADTSELREKLGWVDRSLPAERGEADVEV